MNICEHALNAQCDLYDGFEPAKVCVEKGGEGCSERYRLGKKQLEVNAVG